MNSLFTYAQAEEVAEDFEDLIETEYTSDGTTYEIESIIIRAAEGIAQYDSLEDYYTEDKKTKQPARATNDEQDYEILLVAYAGKTLEVTRLTEYVANNGIKYNFPESDD
jgi:hypothetical protein